MSSAVRMTVCTCLRKRSGVSKSRTTPGNAIVQQNENKSKSPYIRALDWSRWIRSNEMSAFMSTLYFNEGLLKRRAQKCSKKKYLGKSNNHLRQKLDIKTFFFKKIRLTPHARSRDASPHWCLYTSTCTTDIY